MADQRKKAIIVGTIAFLFLTLSLVVSIYVRQINQMIQTESDSYLLEISKQSVKALNRKLDGDLRMLRAMAIVLGASEEIDIGHWVETLGDDPLFQQFQRIGIILPNGRGYGQDVSGTNFSDRVYFKKAMRGTPYISDVLTDRTTGVFSYTYAVPIYHEGEIVSVLAAVTNMDVLQGLLFDKPFMGSGHAYLVRQDGEVVLSSKGSEPIENLVTFVGESAQGEDALMSRMKTGSAGTLRCPTDTDELFLSYVPLDINSWYVVTALSAQTVHARSRQILTLTGVSTCVAALVILLTVSTLVVLQVKTRERLYRIAYFDALTGLENKNHFFKTAPALLADGRTAYAYCVLNIKRFQTVNNRFGYPVGDQLLRHAAQVLRQGLGRDETAARFNADVFHLLLKIESNEALTRRLDAMAEEIGKFQPFLAQHYALFTGFGIYVTGQDERSIAAMGDMAKLALRGQRDQLRNTYSFFSESLKSQMLEAQDMENAMRHALADGQFQVYLQPQYRLVGETLAGCEALVRWIHPQKGIIPPDQFIPLFEKNGFITELDLYMFSRICAMLQRWQERGGKPIPVSVNQSRINLMTPGYLDRLISMFQAHNLNPAWLRIEITESTFFDDTAEMISIVSQLHHAGFEVSMDDFGSGYSTLNLLQDLVLDELKLDKNFFMGSTHSDRGRKIVASIISMASDLHMKVVAEGVETAEQAVFLTACGCDLAQGYYYARPMPWKDFEKKAGLV